MGVQADPSPGPARPAPAVLRRLLPPGDPAGAEAIVEGLAVWERPPTGLQRPFVMLNMASTADGRASLGGRSGQISGPADRELFHELRGSVDAVMAGAGTVRAERYGRIIRDDARALRREARGLQPEPFACVVTGSVSLPPDLPLLADPAARVVIVTPSRKTLPESAAQVDYVRAERDGGLDLPAALAELHERLGVRTLLCEGGPHLNGRLLGDGVVDELFLSLSPKLAGGDLSAGDSLRIVAGKELDPPVELELLWLLECDSTLFARYGVRSRTSPARV